MALVIYKNDRVEAFICWEPSSNSYKLKDKSKKYIQQLLYN